MAWTSRRRAPSLRRSVSTSWPVGRGTMRMSVVDSLMAGYSSASWAIGVLFSDCITKDTPPPFTSPNTTFGYTPGESLKDVVRRLLRQAASVGVRPRLLLLDRGSYSVAVVRYLRAARYPFLMPVVCHGRPAKQAGGPTGSYVFRTWKKGGWSRYTLTDAK